MPKTPGSWSLIFVSAVAIAAVLVFLGLGTEDSSVSSTEAPDSAAKPTAKKIGKTVGSEWRWDNFETEESIAKKTDRTAMQEARSEAAPDRVFDVPFIYSALQEVRLDDEGNVVTDGTTLRALNEALAYNDLEMNATQLAELQNLIRIGLPGKAGAQAADIVAKYYGFLQAEKEFNTINRTPGMELDPRAGYEELQALRSLYLGDELAANLFAQEERDANYMMESMLLEQDESLSEEERLRRQQELSNAYHHATPDVANWDERFRLYQSEQQAILNSAVSEEDKRSQLDLLTARHFTEEEMAAAQNFLNGPSADGRE